MIAACCDKDFRPGDLAPFIRYADGTIGYICRGCCSRWIKEGFLHATWPFWRRQQEAETLIAAARVTLPEPIHA